MLTYLAICAVQFPIIASLMVGGCRKIDTRWGGKCTGMGAGGWAISILCSLLPIVGAVAVVLGSVIAGNLAFSVKWGAD